MGAVDMLALLVTHPLEFRTLIQYKLWHDTTRNITDREEHETSGWDRPAMRRCWGLLDETSRSFSGVIKELEGDLARAICLFYLILRALDTIEDDMTLADEKKQPLLRNFHKLAMTPGWNFTECGPNEKDRHLLVEWPVVQQELEVFDPRYREVVLDICEKMGNGMADYTHKAATTPELYVATTDEYNLYCHYVAGVVGEGLSRIWSASGKEAPWLGLQLELSNSMGLMLQKTNIIRDFREDAEERRFWWPREIWSRIADVKDLRELYAPGNEKTALWVQSAMVVDALGHAVDALDYLCLLKKQSVFAFCAIPQTMAMATLSLCFMNYTMFQRNIKIRKAEAASLIMRSTNPRDVSFIFREYARSIHARADPADPSYLRIAVACGRIEQWCEHRYPSFVQLSQKPGGGIVFDPTDARTKIIEAATIRDREIMLEERAKGRALEGPKPANDASTSEMMFYVAGGFVLVLAISLGGLYLLMQFMDDGAIKLRT